MVRILVKTIANSLASCIDYADCEITADCVGIRERIQGVNMNKAFLVGASMFVLLVAFACDSNKNTAAVAPVDNQDLVTFLSSESDGTGPEITSLDDYEIWFHDSYGDDYYLNYVKAKYLSTGNVYGYQGEFVHCGISSALNVVVYVQGGDYIVTGCTMYAGHRAFSFSLNPDVGSGFRGNWVMEYSPMSFGFELATVRRGTIAGVSPSSSPMMTDSEVETKNLSRFSEEER